MRNRFMSRRHLPGIAMGLMAVTILSATSLLCPAPVQAQSRHLETGAYGMQAAVGTLSDKEGLGYRADVAFSISGILDVGLLAMNKTVDHEQFRVLDSESFMPYARMFFIRPDEYSHVFVAVTTAFRRVAFAGDSLVVNDQGLSSLDFLLGISLHGKIPTRGSWEFQPGAGVENIFSQERLAYGANAAHFMDVNDVRIWADLTLARQIGAGRHLLVTPGIQYNGRYFTYNLDIGWAFAFPQRDFEPWR